MFYPHLILLSLLGFAFLWGIRIVYGNNKSVANDSLTLCITIGGWVLVFLGIGLSTNPVVALIAILIASASLSRYRESERRALLWTLAAAAEREIPLHEAAHAFALNRNDEIARRATRLAELLESGVPLPTAMRRSRNPLPADTQLAVNLGHTTDALADPLREAAQSGGRFVHIWNPLYEQAGYLLLIIILTTGVGTFMTLRIMPTIVQICIDYSVQTPWVTQSYIDSFESDSVLALLGVLAAVGCVIVIVMLARYVGGGHREPPLLGRWLGTLDGPILLQALARGVEQNRSLEETIDLAARWYPKRRVGLQLAAAASDIRSGQEWTECLRRARLMRQSDAAVLQAAQRAGNLPWALREMSDRGSRQLSNRIQAVTHVVSPMILVSIGLAVGFMTASYFLPIIMLIHQMI